MQENQIYLTKEDFELMLEQGFKKFGEDLLQIVATKDDLKNFATKDDLKNFATKDDLKDFVKRDELHDWKNEILNSNDKVITELQAVRLEQAAIHANYKNVETRLEKVEIHVGLKPQVMPTAM